MANLDTTFLIALGAAILGAASLVLHVVAPRTKNTIDDAIRDDIDQVLGFIRGQTPIAAAVAAPPPKPPIAPVAMLLIALLGVSAAATLPACATARPVATTGVSAFLDCEDQHFDAKLMADAVNLAKATVESWISGAGTVSAEAIKADVAPIKSDLGKCAIAAAIAAMTSTPAASTPGTAVSALTAAGPPPADASALRAAFAAARGELGWQPVVTNGIVL